MGYWGELRAWLLRDPAKLIRYLVLFVCCIVVIVQLYECFSKLSHPPISTHSYYNVNETIEMPAITICREPPYKEEVLETLSNGNCPHPGFATCWMNYPYGELPLEEFFMNGTFNLDETFYSYGLNGEPSNVDIDSSLHFYMGRCFTLRPKIAMKRVSKQVGYSLILEHNLVQSTSSVDLIYGAGWHIFIHDKRENFTEINMKGSGRVEYVFVNIREEIEIKLQSQFFSNVETREQECSRKEGYSDLKCGEICIWKDLAEEANCSGPWMHDIEQEPCNDNASMRNLIEDYHAVYDGDDDFNCNCLQPCESRIYTTYIQSRKTFAQPEPRTLIFIYYTTKLISQMIEERPSYDTTQFIADVGGSLGFLLGLSVLGLIGILEHLTLFFCGDCIKRLQKKNEKRARSESPEDVQSQASDETVDVNSVYIVDSEKLDKY
ncbi:acid-sensing ion channel 4-A isoform X1 [Drosophila innubila]|uniref:acid-sensing ion channel 4-A isoform X1 n=1 Tax=Drosophila innubila TaxID=198719 RepID=UPI00148E63F8|nr:acid-sensing ion channel 4-A isoform X1 [Drosophila innubila]